MLYVVQCRLAGKDLFHLLLAVLMLDDFQNKPDRSAELLKVCDVRRRYEVQLIIRHILQDRAVRVEH